MVLRDLLSPDRVVKEYLDRWRDSELPPRMPPPVVFASGSMVDLTLIAVYGPHQGQRYASHALRMLTALCDENGVTISLVARPTGNYYCPATRSLEQLIAWYTRHGFVETTPPGCDTRTMSRKPRTAVTRGD